jgi:hypothetical protein
MLNFSSTHIIVQSCYFTVGYAYVIPDKEFTIIPITRLCTLFSYLFQTFCHRFLYCLHKGKRGRVVPVVLIHHVRNFVYRCISNLAVKSVCNT